MAIFLSGKFVLPFAKWVPLVYTIHGGFSLGCQYLVKLL